MHFICRSFTPNSSENSWSQYWENEPDDNQKYISGHLFGLITITSNSPSSRPLSEICHQLIAEINAAYFREESDDILTNLKKSVNSCLSNEIYQSINLALSLNVIKQKKLYGLVYGLNLLFVHRHDNLSQLITGKIGEYLSVYGNLETGDELFICTENFLSEFGIDILKDTLSRQELSQKEEEISSLLISSPHHLPLAASIIILSPDESDLSGASFQSQISSPEPSIINQSKTASLIPKFIQEIFKPHTYARISPPSHLKNKKYLQTILALFVLTLLVGSVLFSLNKNYQKKKEQTYNTLIAQLDSTLKQAEDFKSIDFNQAKTYADQSRDIYNQLVKNGLHLDNLNSYKDKLSTISTQTGNADVQEPAIVYDNSKSPNNSQYQKLFYGDTLMLLDNQTGRLDSLDLTLNSINPILVSEKIKNSLGFSFDSGVSYVYFSDRVLSVSQNTSKVILTLDSQESPKILSLDMWNGNIYFVSESPKNIWRSSPSGAIFSAPQNWLKEGEVLSETTSAIRINGKIWTIDPNGTITSYLRGKKDVFAPTSALPKQGINHLAVSTKSDYLAFSDLENFVYVYHKDGTSLGKYNFSSFPVLDLSLSSTERKLYVLSSNQKIYRIDF